MKAAGTYATPQNGALVYVFDIGTVANSSDPSYSQVSNIDVIGYYYFSSGANKWMKLTPATPVQDLRFVGTNNHVTQDAGVGSNGTSLGTGSNNIAIGNGALNSITTSSSIVAIGPGALSKLTSITNNDAVAIGNGALGNLTTQIGNTAVGSGALSSATSTFNTAVGVSALGSAKGDGLNTAVGSSALASLGQGDTNTSLGYRTASQLLIGYRNTFLGGNTAVFLKGGGAQHNDNTFVGAEITTTNAVNPGVNVTYKGTTALGHLSLNKLGSNVTDITNGLFLGKNTTVDQTLVGVVDHATAIGTDAVVGKSNSIVLGRPPLSGAVQDNVGIGVIAPTNALHVKTTSNPVKFEGLVADATAANVVVVGTDGILKTAPKSGFAPSTVDMTDDAWVNNISNARVELGTTSAGAARVAGTEIVATDAGALGLGTIAPAATLDVTGEPTNTAKLDAILPPRLTGDQLKAKTYTTAQNGAVVFATAGVSTSAAGDQTSDVNIPGLYYFDGPTNKWIYSGSNPVMATYMSKNYQALDLTSNADQLITFASNEAAVNSAATFNSTNSSFTILYDGYYQLTGFIGFNANRPDFTTATQYVAVNLKIKKGATFATSADITGIRSTYVGIAAGTGTAIQIPSTILKLNKGDILYMAIQRPGISIGPQGGPSYANQTFGQFLPPNDNNGHINLPGGQSYTKSFTILKVK